MLGDLKSMNKLFSLSLLCLSVISSCAVEQIAVRPDILVKKWEDKQCKYPELATPGESKYLQSTLIPNKRKYFFNEEIIIDLEIKNISEHIMFVPKIISQCDLFAKIIIKDEEGNNVDIKYQCGRLPDGFLAPRFIAMFPGETYTTRFIFGEKEEMFPAISEKGIYYFWIEFDTCVLKNAIIQGSCVDVRSETNSAGFTEISGDIVGIKRIVGPAEIVIE